MKNFGGSGGGDTDLESIQGWILKVGEDIFFCISVEIFIDWLANQSSPWKDYCTFMSGRLVALDKKPGIFLVRVGETLRLLFAKCVLKVTGPKATNSCQDGQICDGLKSVINGGIYGVLASCDANLSTEDWVFRLVDEKTFQREQSHWNDLDSLPFMAVRSSFFLNFYCH